MESPKNVPSSSQKPGQPSQGSNVNAPGGKYDPSQAEARQEDVGDEDQDQDAEIGDRKGGKDKKEIRDRDSSARENK